MPVTFQSDAETVEGDFILAMWESLADPVVTGRADLGWPKLWANIPDPILLPEFLSRERGLARPSGNGFCALIITNRR